VRDKVGRDSSTGGMNRGEAMRATKLEKMGDQLNDQFPKVIKDSFFEKWQLSLEMGFNIFSMRCESRRMDGENFTPEQFAWIEAFSEGYTQAMLKVRQAALR
jgi:hypothetical protein